MIHQTNAGTTISSQEIFRGHEMAQLKDHILQQKTVIESIASRYQATNIRLFGSAVRGDDHEGGDIDLLVDFKPGSTLWDQIGMIEELSERLGCRVDVVSSRALNKFMRHRILQEAVPL